MTKTKHRGQAMSRMSVLGAALAICMVAGYNAMSVQAVPVPVNTGSHCLITPSACGYPDATNTGVPVNAKLTASGPLDIRTPGTVITNLDVTGSITVRAQGVIIRNTRITNTGPQANANGALQVMSGGSAIVTDSEIDGGTASIAVGHNDFTLRRVEIKGGVDAIRAGSNVGVYDSYVHSLTRLPKTHNDILQTIAGSNISINHNTLYAFSGQPGVWPAGGDPMNAVYMLGNMKGNVENILVTNNLVNGGNYSFNANWKTVDAGEYTAKSIRILNNRFGRDHRYGAGAGMTHGIVFKGNAYVDDGTAIK